MREGCLNNGRKWGDGKKVTEVRDRTKNDWKPNGTESKSDR